MKSEGRSLDDLSLEVINAGVQEMRKAGINPEGDIVLPLEIRSDILAGTSTQGSETVAENKSNLLGPLRENLVLVKAGAQYLTGMVNNFSIPTYGGTSALWKGEVEAAVDGAGEFDEVEFSPKRLTAFVEVSKQFLIQNSTDAENLLKQDILNAVAAKLENTILGNSSGTTQPTGLFYSTPSISGKTWSTVVSLETSVDNSNAMYGNMAYITSAGGRGALKVTDKSTSSGKFLLEGNEMNGYPVYVTNHVYHSGSTVNGIVFANWSDLIIVQWGSTDIVIDSITKAKEGKIILIVNAYFDAKFRRTASYATGLLK